MDPEFRYLEGGSALQEHNRVTFSKWDLASGHWGLHDSGAQVVGSAVGTAGAAWVRGGLIVGIVQYREGRLQGSGHAWDP